MKLPLRLRMWLANLEASRLLRRANRKQHRNSHHLTGEPETKHAHGWGMTVAGAILIAVCFVGFINVLASDDHVRGVTVASK